MIIFTETLPDRVLYSHNNSIIQFYSNHTSPAVKATITSVGIDAIIYPDMNGKFYFNFKEYVSTLVNETNFKDTLITDLPSVYNYQGSDFFRIWYDLTALIIVDFEDLTDETTALNRTFIAGALDLDNYKRQVYNIDSHFPLLPLKPKSNNQYFAKHWEGYPFDMMFWRGTFPTPLARLDNNTTLSTWDLGLNFSSVQNRFVISDGATDTTFENEFIIANGLNKLQYIDTFIDLVKVANPCEGVYLKWFYNGGFLYWLFPSVYNTELSSQNNGEINTDFDNLDKSFGKVSQLGKSTNKVVNVDSDLLTNDESNFLQTILKSTKVYYFTGVPNTKADPTDWIEIRVANKNQTIRNNKGQPISISLSLILPDDDNLQL
jgi:hypothetical protein